MVNLIETDTVSQHLRSKALDTQGRRILITKFTGSQQENDLTEPPNCGGLGRIRHFRRSASPGWPTNPLPIDPALKALGHAETETLSAQLFQNAVCNWRCWYCYVPYLLLSGDLASSQWLSAAELMDLYLNESDRPSVIVLSGGQPDLTPEWIPWMMEEIKARRLENSVYLWSDDNLSNDFFWRYLSDKERAMMADYPCYGRVCCFKGFDAESFSFNTQAEPEMFDRQFMLMERLLTTGMDLYAYVTLTCVNTKEIDTKMADFIDRLQALEEPAA